MKNSFCFFLFILSFTKLFSQGVITGPTVVCGTQTVTYCYSGSCNCPGSTWQVAAPQTANFSANANPLCTNVSFPAQGNYTIEYVIASGCNCTAGTIISLQVTVVRPTTALFTTFDFCENSSNTVNASDSTGVYTFNPVPGDGATIDSLTGVISNGVGGNSYTVVHTTGAPCSSTSQVTINCLPASDPRCSSHPCNLIKNGDFEDYSSCPTGNGQMSKANNWYQGTTSGGSSDYFNTCGHMNTGGGITPPLPFPGGVGCAGVYTNYTSTAGAQGWNGYYKEEFAQKLDFCAGQKYTLSLYCAKPATGSYTNLQGNVSFKIGNAAILPTAAFNAVTRCETNFIEATNVNGTLITAAWQQFTRTFTATQNANAFIVAGNCLGPYTATGYAFVDDMKLIPVDTMLVSPTNISTCDTAFFTVTIPGGCYGPYDFTINNGTQTDTVFNIPSNYTHFIYPATSGTYTITSVINKFGCSTPLNIPITVTGGSNVNITQNPNICTGQTYTLPGGTVVSTSGTYVDTVSAASGCDSIITTNLTVGNAVTSSQNPIICSGQNYTLPGGAVVTTAGTYMDTISLGSGCDSIITTNLTVNPAVTSSQNPSICTGQNYTLPGGTVVSTAGTYMDTLLSSSGCDSIITTTLTVSNALTANQSFTLCQGTNFTLPGGTVVSTSGTYLDTLTSTGGCDSIITTNLTYNANSTNSQTPIICSNETYTLPSGTAVSTSGTYTDTLTNIYGCDSIITTILTVNPQPTTTISPNVTIQPGDNTSLIATGGASYTWSPGTGLDNTTSATVIASPAQTTTYCVKIIDANGCVDSICVTVFVELPCPTNENLQVPNAFSPNNDNVNDEFCLQGWDGCIEDFQIYIYNRWGEKVYESKDPNFCWDGKQMDAQVFVYYLKAKYSNFDDIIIKRGNISLIR